MFTKQFLFITFAVKQKNSQMSYYTMVIAMMLVVHAALSCATAANRDVGLSPTTQSQDIEARFGTKTFPEIANNDASVLRQRQAKVSEGVFRSGGPCYGFGSRLVLCIAYP